MKKQLTSMLSIAIIAFLTMTGFPLSGQSFVIVETSATNNRLRKTDKPIQNEYIVVLKTDVSRWDLEGRANEIAGTFGGQIIFYYKHALRGFAVRMSEPAALALSRHPLVDFVEENAADEPSGTQVSPPNWGLDRIDQFSLPLNDTYNYPGDGTGVHAFVIDTGILSTHQDFRRTNGTSRVDLTNSADFVADGFLTSDCNGHGTAVASVLGGKIYGVAKNVTLYSVRIGNCTGQGTTARKIAGLDYVAGKTNLRPAVANYSWNNTSFGSPDSIGVAAQGVIDSGVTLVNSAGNDNADAGNYTPTNLPAVIVVGATDIVDRRSTWTFPPSTTVYASNFGSVVDLFAPGIDIRTAGISSNNGIDTRSGTSFAAPHVAGAAAIYLQTNPFATPAQVQTFIVNRAAPGKVRNVPAGTTQKLLYVY
jgi:subtilisin family serine protease